MDEKAKKYTGGIIKLCTAGVLLFFLLWHVSIGELTQVLARASLSLLVFAISLQYASVFLGSINQYILFQPFIGVSFKQFASPYFKAFTAGLLIPGQLGDVSIVLFLKKKDLHYSQTLSIYIWDKYITFIFYVFVVSMFLIDFLGYPKALLPILLTGIVLISGVFLYSFSSLGEAKNSNQMLRRLFSFFRNTISQVACYGKRHPMRLLMNCALTFFKFMLVMLCYHAVFRSLGYNLPFLKVGEASIASGIVAYLPISMQGVGTVEITAIWVFKMLGVGAAAVLSGFLLLRASMYLFAMIVFSVLALSNVKTFAEEGNTL